MKNIRRITVLLLLFGLLITNSVYSAEAEKPIHLIIWNEFCVIVRSPAQQLTTMLGHVPLGIILKDKKTRITISNCYLVISVPPSKLEAILVRLKTEPKIFLE